MDCKFGKAVHLRGYGGGTSFQLQVGRGGGSPPAKKLVIVHGWDPVAIESRPIPLPLIRLHFELHVVHEHAALKLAN